MRGWSHCQCIFSPLSIVRQCQTGISFTGEELELDSYLDVYSSTARSETLVGRHKVCSQRAAPAEPVAHGADDEHDFKASQKGGETGFLECLSVGSLFRGLVVGS